MLQMHKNSIYLTKESMVTVIVARTYAWLCIPINMKPNTSQYELTLFISISSINIPDIPSMNPIDPCCLNKWNHPNRKHKEESIASDNQLK